MPPPRKNDGYDWGDVWRNPSSSAKDKDFNWGEVNPDQIDPALVRQVRIMLAAGKGHHEITSWLRQNGMSADQAGALLGTFAAARQSDKNERGCGRAALGLITTFTLFVLGLVLYRRPWDGDRWTWRRGGSEIPAAAGFLLFCFMYAAAMTVLWFLAMRFGAMLDQASDKQAPGRQPFVRRFVLLFVLLLAIAALLLYLGS